jgi:hypothetical protein
VFPWSRALASGSIAMSADLTAGTPDNAQGERLVSSYQEQHHVP